MANYLADIEAVLKGEEVEGVMIGPIREFYGDDPWEVSEYRGLDERDIPKAHRNVVISWEEAAPLLDYEYHDGYGGVDCAAIHIWTPTRVLFLACYDGATWVDALPRHPDASSMPRSHGGG